MSVARYRSLMLIAALLALSGSLRAQFVLTVLSDASLFTASDPVLGFNSITNLTPIDQQYALQGVYFDGSLAASTNPGDTNLYPNNADGGIATNWDGSPVLTWTVTFAVPQTRVVFLVEMNTNDVLQLAPSLDGTSHGSVTYSSASNIPVNFGVSDPAGFNSLTFTISGANNHFFAMDNFRYQYVPEPSTWALLGLGFAATSLLGRVGRFFPKRS